MIGFQGNDPVTDFRGSGFLGLLQLHSFSLGDKRADNVFKVAVGEKTWYFYAATAINISGKVIQFIENGNCDQYLYNFFKDVEFNKFILQLYSDFFVGFNDLWVKTNQNDFMKVNILLEEFMNNNAKEIYQSLIGRKVMN